MTIIILTTQPNFQQIISYEIDHNQYLKYG